ncbi:hypothetical protein HZC34_03540 [Candidatus Saganbacteria bacterium]|nr:hypothetical protein [Candidatus Saganbacteria bacterium]
MKVFSNRYFQIISIVFLIVLFWWPILFNNDFFMDDWTFINKVQSGSFSFGSLFVPDNGHFAPIGKAVYFAMLKIFGANIFTFMCFSIIMHAIASLLVLYFLKAVFSSRPVMAFLLTLFYALNTAYFEILHWPSALGQAYPFLAILATFLLLHHSAIKKKKGFYFASIAVSFFMPMNYMSGFLGIVFIFLYYFLVLDKEKALKEKILFFLPYVLVWLSYLAVYLTFSLSNLLSPGTAPHLTFDAGRLASYAVFGFLGLVFKNLGFSTLVFPYTTGMAAFLAFMLAFFLLFIFLYFILNKKEDRIPLLKERGLIAFSSTSIIICYIALAVGRAAIEADAFLNWGRYHYLPMFFFTLFLGAMIPQFIGIFSKLFDRKRFKIFMAIIFMIFLLNQFILIRQKSESPIRIEGALPIVHLHA